MVGAHHDGWFRAAFDNASGVAVMLGMARAMIGRPAPPPHDLLHSRTAEEFGQADSEYDWCTGAHGRSHTRTRSGARQPVPPLRRGIRPHRAAAARRGAVGADRLGAYAAPRPPRGLLTTAGGSYPPGTGTELWPLLVAGVPGISVLTWGKSFSRTAYHSPLDTIKLVDFGHLERLTRFYAYLLLPRRRRSGRASSTTARGPRT